VLDAIRAGVYPQPVGNIGINCVDVRDIAEAAAIALTQPGHSGKTYSVVGPRAWTGAGISEMLSRHLGKPVVYTGNDLKAWAAAMRPFHAGLAAARSGDHVSALPDRRAAGGGSTRTASGALPPSVSRCGYTYDPSALCRSAGTWIMALSLGVLPFCTTRWECRPGRKMC